MRADGDDASPPEGVSREHIAAHVTALMRERVYATVSCLATLTILARTPHGQSAWGPAVDVAIMAGGLAAASMFAELVAHLAVYRHPPRGRAAMAVARTAGQALQAVYVPMVPLVLAGVGWLTQNVSTWIAIGILIAELGVFSLLATRRTQLGALQRFVTTLGLIGVGALVVVIKMLSH